MSFSIEYIQGAPVAWSDDFYSKEEVDLMFRECDNLRKRNFLSHDTNGAIDENQAAIKNNKGVFLEQLYQRAYVLSDILTSLTKLHSEDFIKEMEGMHPYFRTLGSSKHSSTLLTYYDAKAYYGKHIDCSYITVLSWFYEEPKSFSGGDLVVENELTLECKMGRVVLMPGWLKHEVTSVEMPEVNKDKGLGRYSVSHFVVQR